MQYCSEVIEIILSSNINLTCTSVNFNQIFITFTQQKNEFTLGTFLGLV